MKSDVQNTTSVFESSLLYVDTNCRQNLKNQNFLRNLVMYSTINKPSRI